MALEGSWNGMALRLRRTNARLSIAGLVGKLAEQGWSIDGSSVSRWEAPPASHVARQPGDDGIVASLASIFGCSSMAFYRTTILTYDRSEDLD